MNDTRPRVGAQRLPGHGMSHHRAHGAGLIGRALRGVRHQEYGAPPMKYHHIPYHHHADYFGHPQGGHGYPWPQPYPNPNTSRAAQHYIPA